MPQQYLSPIEDVIEDARNGRMFILIDDESRENEGDLIIPAQMATPEAINFMAKHGRGLICLALTTERVQELGLSLMASANKSRHQTAFTVSIEARDGVTTGISAHDRARTVAVAIDSAKGKDDIATPGHVFPLMARDGGVLVRAGHTEAAVDVARLAGLIPAGVICEVMNDDGTMARLPDLVKFAKAHGIKVATIADLIRYRLAHDRLVECTLESKFQSHFGGEWAIKVYVNKAEYDEVAVLVKGDITTAEPVPVRMHVIHAQFDILGDIHAPVGVIPACMNLIAKEGRGVIVLFRNNSKTAISHGVRTLMGMKKAKPPPLRDYGIGAQILLDLGVRDMILLSNTSRSIIGLDGYGLTVVEQRPIPVEETWLLHTDNAAE